MEKQTEALSIYKALQITPVSKVDDLVGCMPMLVRINRGQREGVLKMLIIALDKCTLSMGFDVPDGRLMLLAADILEAYKYDAIEDVIEALKQGRQLLLERPPHASRSTFSMEYVAHWMKQILDKKGLAREKLLDSKYKESKEPLPEVDYDSYRARVVEERKDKKGRHEQAAHDRKKVREYANNIIETHKKDNNGN